MAKPDEAPHRAVGDWSFFFKLIGALAAAGVDISTGYIILTARCSLELVQKAILANCPMLVTISAATDLAIETAARYGLRLISLARPDGALNVTPQSD